ncbi:fatty acid desaturase [Pedobacter sp. AW31-3R]|uniref:fatty acid desaturase n=1 Tax=Pedobacter sp. AW31-3R TaxID=3445781 RepID=UPI003FA032D4
MTFLDVVLDPPAYGWKDANGELAKPTAKQIFTEFFSRLNIFRSRKNWLPLFSWLKVILTIPMLCLFLFYYFSWPLLIAAFLYSMIVMGTHGTIWHHRYCTHGAYTFRNKFWRFFTQNLTISMIPEEIYVVSHHVHHAKSDTPGDPYNAFGGFLYCFLADVNHQPIAKDLSEKDYYRATRLMKHTGVTPNTYAQYLEWGSIANPMRTILSTVLNWGFWYAAFYLIGGHGLACTLFGAAGIWAVGVRTFNYEGHGKGKDMRRDHCDYNRDDMSINQLWPGFVAGEWHNNHHLFPKSARTGFLPHQIDIAWYYIHLMYKLGPVTAYRDSKNEFYNEHVNKKP